MTTETRQDARRTGVSTLVRASTGALAAGVVTALAGLVVVGREALLAGLVGTAVVVSVLFSGALVVAVVAELMPSASLMVALMTYTLQMVLLAVLLIPLSGTAWAAEHLAPAWLAAAVIVGALVWTLAQVLISVRVRIPVYDLPAPEAVEASSGASPEAEGGAR